MLRLTVFRIDRVVIRLPAAHVDRAHPAKTIRGDYAADDNGGRVDRARWPAASAPPRSEGRGRRRGPRKSNRHGVRASHGHFVRVLRVGTGWSGGKSRPVVVNGGRNAFAVPTRPNTAARFRRGQHGRDNDGASSVTRWTTVLQSGKGNCSSHDDALYGTASAPAVSAPSQIVTNAYYTLDPVVPYAP